MTLAVSVPSHARLIVHDQPMLSPPTIWLDGDTLHFTYNLYDDYFPYNSGFSAFALTVNGRWWSDLFAEEGRGSLDLSQEGITPGTHMIQLFWSAARFGFFTSAFSNAVEWTSNAPQLHAPNGLHIDSSDVLRWNPVFGSEIGGYQISLIIDDTEFRHHSQENFLAISALDLTVDLGFEIRVGVGGSIFGGGPQYWSSPITGVVLGDGVTWEASQQQSETIGSVTIQGVPHPIEGPLQIFTGFHVDDSYVLHWDPIYGAEFYQVSIWHDYFGVTFDPEMNYVSLADLLEELADLTGPISIHGNAWEILVSAWMWRDQVSIYLGGSDLTWIAPQEQRTLQQPEITTPNITVAPNLNTASDWAHEVLTEAVNLSLVPWALQVDYVDNATRAEFASLAVALYETATGRVITGRMEFNDTNDINVQKMGYLGVVTGVGEGNFNPNGQLTREQAAVMLVRLADAIGMPLPPAQPTFADNSAISSWAVDAVGAIQSAGIMGGVGDNQFAPQGDYTREQSIITVLRLFEILN